MDQIALEMQHISRLVDFPGGMKTVLRDISFRLPQGRVMSVLGPSGAGKSTLLRLLNRLDDPSSGRILVDGRDSIEIKPSDLRRRIGMVMQRPYLFPGTAAANVGYGPAQHGKPLVRTQIDELLKQTGMAGYADQDVAMLSGGEAQRVSIARALANEPEILLLDEPTSALDDASKRGIEELLTTLVRSRHATCVWVTHDVAQAARVADLVLKIEGGQAVALGTAQEMLDA